MEAVWLTALISTPLFFNFRGESVESEKNYLLRSLAIVLMIAWAIKSIGQLGFRTDPASSKSFSFRSLIKTPLVAPTILVTLGLLIATLMSLSPWVSFWGVVVRRLGSFTYLSCLTFFVAMATCIRSRQQIDRIVTAAILTSIPISLYGIGQRFSIEPIMRLRGPETSRVTSTFAHAIYLGAYLIMILPTTLSRLLRHYSEFRSASHWRSANLFQSVIYGLTLVAQLGAIFLTVSRGPFVGLAIGSVIMFLMLAVYWRKRWLVLGTLGGGAALLAVLALLAWPDGPFRTFASRFEFQRFSELLNPKVGTGSERAAAWRVAVQASRFSKVVDFGEGRRDPIPGLRFLIGYGPENVGPVSRMFTLEDFNAALPDHTHFDRFHNDFWETLITTGMLGLAAYLTLTFLVVYHACKWLGFVSTARQKTVFWSAFLGGGMITALGLMWWQGVGFIGVGLRFGTSLGLMTYLVWISWRNEFNRVTQGIPMDRAYLIIALLCGVVAHLIEINFSFIFETSLLLFWTYIALLLVLGHRWSLVELNSLRFQSGLVVGKIDSSLTKRVSSAGKTAQIRGAPNQIAAENPAFCGEGLCHSWRADVSGGLMFALVLINLGVMLIQKTDARSTLQTIVDALTRLPGNNNAFTWSLLLSTVTTWLIFSFTVTNESGTAILSRQRLRSLAVSMMVSAAIGLFYWVVLAEHTVLMLPFPEINHDSMHRFLRERVFILDFHYGFTLLLILSLGAVLIERRSGDPTSSGRWSPFNYLCALLIALGAITAVCASNLKWAKAGMIGKLAKEEYFQREEQWPITVAMLETAIEAVPAAESQYLALGKILLERTPTTKRPEERQALYLRADRVLERGSRLEPLEPSFPLRRGNLYSKWAAEEQAVDKKKKLGRKALEFYQQAITQDPGNFTVWNSLAYIHLTELGSLDEAHRCLLRSLELQPKSHPAYGLLGDVFFQKGFPSKVARDRTVFLRSAATNYQHALALVGTNSSEISYRYTVALGKSLFNLGNLAQAIDAYQSAAELSPPADRWRNEEILARLYSDIKNQTNALDHLRRAIDLAPEEMRTGLTNLKIQILSRP